MKQHMTAKSSVLRSRVARLSMIVALLMVLSSPVSGRAFELLLGTNQTGTFSYFAGQTLCRLITSHREDLQCRVVPGQGQLHNLTNIRGGSLDLGLIDSQMLVDALSKKGPFEFLGIDYSPLRVVAPLYDVPVSLIVREDADIASLGDLAGKKVNAGLPGSRQNRIFKRVMHTKGWSADDFALIEELPSTRSEESMAFCHGTIQAMIHIGIHPDPGLEEMFQRCPASLTGLDDKAIKAFIESHAGYFSAEIAASTYPSVSEEIQTLGTKVVLVASEDLDAQTVTNVLDVLSARQSDLRKAHDVFSRYVLQKPDIHGAGLNLHPGAAAYYREQGLQ